MISNKLISDAVNMIADNISSIAIGTGSEPLPDDTDLDQKTIEKEGTTYIDDNTVIAELYIDETEGNDVLFTNVGIFSSLELYAGGAINEIKDSTQSLTVSIEISIERGWYV